jgi:4-diphosphocytidyl-2-C-methyl-D-erythritol kinase
MPASSETVRLRAYAKLNLTLEVLGRRADGYHELRSLVQCISLADDVTVQATGSGIAVSVAGQWAPEGRENICHRAAELFQARAGRPAGVAIHLAKRIPAGRGLAGGSSDAAATLRGLSELADQPLAEEELAAIAAELGSDVPLFLGQGTAVISGRGTRIEPVTPQWGGAAFVVAWPEISVATAEAYAWLEQDDFSDGEITAAARDALAAGQLAGERHLFNCFERTVEARRPETRALRRRLAAATGRSARLSGSGSAAFSICADVASAQQAAEVMRREEYQAVAVEPVPAGVAMA